MWVWHPTSIAYMGHSSSCDEFKHIHKRKSHEVLLTILNKKKKLLFGVETEFDPTKQNSDVQVDADADIADTTQVVHSPCAKEATFELNNTSPNALSMLAKNVTSTQNLPNNHPNPCSFTDIHLMNEEKQGENLKMKKCCLWWTLLMTLLGEIKMQEENSLTKPLH